MLSYFQRRRYPDGMRVESTEIGLELLDGDAHRIGWGRAPLKVRCIIRHFL